MHIYGIYIYMGDSVELIDLFSGVVVVVVVVAAGDTYVVAGGWKSLPSFLHRTKK